MKKTIKPNKLLLTYMLAGRYLMLIIWFAVLADIQPGFVVNWVTDKWKYKAKNSNKTQLYVEYKACKCVSDRNHSYINSAIVFHCQDGRQVASLQVFRLFKTSNIELLWGQIFEFNQKEECKQNHIKGRKPAKGAFVLDKTTLLNFPSCEFENSLINIRR